MARQNDRVEMAGQVQPQCPGEQAVAFALQRIAPLGREHRRGADAQPAALQQHGRGLGDPRVGGQARFEVRQGHALFLDLHGAVQPSRQPEAAVVGRDRHRIVHLEDGIRIGKERRAQLERAQLAARDAHAGHGRPGVVLRLLPPADAAGLRAAEHFGGRFAELLPEHQGGAGRQGAAGRKDVAQDGAQPTERQQFGQPRELRGAADQHGGRREARQPLVQQARRIDGGCVEHPPGGEGPEHAEQQPVEMRVRRGRDEARVADGLAPERFQRRHLGLELRQRLAHRFRLAGASGGVDVDRGAVGIDRREAGGIARAVRHIGRSGVVGTRQARQGAGLGVGRDHGLPARMQDGQQPGGEAAGVVRGQQPAFGPMPADAFAAPGDVFQKGAPVDDERAAAAHGGIACARHGRQRVEWQHRHGSGPRAARDACLHALAHQPLTCEQRAHQHVGDQAVVERPHLARGVERRVAGRGAVEDEEPAPHLGDMAGVAHARGRQVGLAQAREALHHGGWLHQRRPEKAEHAQPRHAGVEPHHGLIVGDARGDGPCQQARGNQQFHAGQPREQARRRLALAQQQRRRQQEGDVPRLQVLQAEVDQAGIGDPRQGLPQGGEGHGVRRWRAFPPSPAGAARW